MNRRLLYSAIFDGSYPFGDMFDVVTTITIPEEMKVTNSVLIIWGGGDISPMLYDAEKSKHTCTDDKPSKRDVIEWELAKEAVKHGIPVIGICRGAQLMCALSGGSLIQDISGHTASHMMDICSTGEKLLTSSLHHQMMFPWDIDYEMIAVAAPLMSRHYIVRPKDSKEDTYLVDVPCEPEIVWFPKTKALAIQGHPEFMTSQARFVEYCASLIKKYCD